MGGTLSVVDHTRVAQLGPGDGETRRPHLLPPSPLPWEGSLEGRPGEGVTTTRHKRSCVLVWRRGKETGVRIINV